MTPEVSFRPFSSVDFDRCLAIFDENCPDYFAPNEREDYIEFLHKHSANYEVCLLDGIVVGAFGVLEAAPGAVSLRWILIDSVSQGQGIGSRMMARLNVLARRANAVKVEIGASHKSEPFFSRFGAKVISEQENGWGPGMHRIDMELAL